jgi:Ca2+-binding RTX toxin-like protein
MKPPKGQVTTGRGPRGVNVEALEARRLYSVTVSEGYPGFYEVEGDDAANTINITVSQDDATFTLDGVTYTGVSYLYVYGRGGGDTIHIAGAPGPIGASVDGGSGGDDIAVNFDGAIWAGPGDDTLRLADAFRGTVYGESGDDAIYIRGQCVDPEVHGGEGGDLIDASRNQYGVALYGDGGNDVIIGSQYADQIYGGGGSNTLYGLSGGDTLYTCNGKLDWVDGGAGDDSLYGDADEAGIHQVEVIVRG